MTKSEATKDVKVIEEAEVPAEVLASSIVALSSAAQRLLASGLSRRALLVLIKDATGVPHKDIGLVLDALPALSRIYTTKGKR